MNLYKIYNDEEDTPEVTMPENPMEKMMSRRRRKGGGRSTEWHGNLRYHAND